MNRLESLIINAKRKEPDLPADFTAQVMSGIQQQDIRVRGALLQRAAPWLRMGLAALFLALGVLVVNALVYELRSNGSLEPLHFGLRYVGGFLADLPFDFLAAAVACSALAVWLLNSGKLARVALVWLITISYGLTSFGGFALAQSGFNDRLRQISLREETLPEPLEWFFHHRAMYRMHNPQVRMGRIKNLRGSHAQLETHEGKMIPVQLPPGMAVMMGQHLRMRGHFQEGQFSVEEKQLATPGHAGRYFSHWEMMRRHMGSSGMPGMHPSQMNPEKNLQMPPPENRGMAPGMKHGGMKPGMGPGMGRGMGPGMMRGKNQSRP